MTMHNDSETLGGMSHTNPYTGNVFGETRAYTRGETIAADGGSVAARDGSETLAAVSHTSEDLSEDTHEAFYRGVREKNE